MIATGTDVKPLECLLFLRNIRSLAYFEQMKGRGCRVMDPDALHMVTPDADAKTHFVLVDAVGVCEDDKAATKPLDRKPSVPLDKILKTVSKGVASADLASTLAARLARLNLQLAPPDRAAIATAAGGKDLPALAGDLVRSIDPDQVHAAAVHKFNLPEGAEPTAKQLKQVEQERTRAALRPFLDPKLRTVILDTRAALEQVIDEQTPDSLLKAGFDAGALEKAKGLIKSFRQFIEDHKGQIEALQVLYSKPFRAGLRYGQVKQLAAALKKPPHRLDPVRLWQAYQAVEPKNVKGPGGKQLVDVIALVRHALDPAMPLAPVGLTVEERYQAWLADQAKAGVAFTDEQRRWLDAIKDHIATSLTIEQEDLDEVPFNTIGGLGRAHELFGHRLLAILQELNASLAA